MATASAKRDALFQRFLARALDRRAVGEGIGKGHANLDQVRAAPHDRQQ